MNLYCVKSAFLFGITKFDKVLKLVEGDIRTLQRQKTLKFLTKIPVKEFTDINFNISSCKPKACSVLRRCL